MQIGGFWTHGFFLRWLGLGGMAQFLNVVFSSWCTLTVVGIFTLVISCGNTSSEYSECIVWVRCTVY